MALSKLAEKLQSGYEYVVVVELEIVLRYDYTNYCCAWSNGGSVINGCCV